MKYWENGKLTETNSTSKRKHEWKDAAVELDRPGLESGSVFH